MSNLVNLDELVPGIAGTTFKYHGEEYKLRGDLASEVVFEFLALYDDLLGFRETAAKAAEVGNTEELLKARDTLEEITGKIRERLLSVFKLEHPDMQELPFGNQTTLIVLGEVLRSMGIGAAVQEAPVENPPKRAPRKKAAPKRTTVKRTTTSRSTPATPRPRRKRRR